MLALNGLSIQDRELIIYIKYFLHSGRHRLRHSRGDGFPSLSLNVRGDRWPCTGETGPPATVGSMAGRPPGRRPLPAARQPPGRVTANERTPACNNAIPQPWPGTRSSLSRAGSRPTTQSNIPIMIDLDFQENIKIKILLKYI